MNDKPKALLCWSSGKDSAWTLHVLRRRRDVEVVGLLTPLFPLWGLPTDALARDMVAAGLKRLIRIGLCTNDKSDIRM